MTNTDKATQEGGVREQANAQNVVLLAPLTVTGAANTNGLQVGGFGWASSLVAQLNVTSVAADNTDTLDVTVQTTIDGTNWLDVIHFTRILGGGSAVVRVAKISAAVAQAEYATSSALAANALRHVLGDLYRVQYVVVSGTAAAFTFGVTANLS